MKLFKIFKSVLLIAAITFVLVEILLRLLTDIFPEPTKSFIETSQRIPHSNLRVCSEFNELTAFRILLPKKEKKNILVLGDSFPFGSNVEYEDTFPALIQRQTGKSVVNLGVAAQGPIQYNRMLEVGMQYDPDLIIYCIFANDFMYFNKTEIKKLSTENTYKRYDLDYDIFVDKMTFNHDATRIIKKMTNPSISIQLIKHKLIAHALFTHSPTKDVFCFNAGENIFCSKKLFWDAFLDWNDDNVKKGISISANFVKEACKFASGQKKNLIVVMIPPKEFIYGPMAKEKDLIYRDSFKKTYLEFEAKLSSQHIPVLNSTPFLESKANKGMKLYFTMDGHFNEAGHRALSEIIIQFLLKTQIYL